MLSQGRWLAGACALGNLADDPPARPTGDFALNLPNAEVGRRGQCLDLPDNPLWDSWTSQVLSSRLGGPHARGTRFVDEGVFRFGQGANKGNPYTPLFC